MAERRTLLMRVKPDPLDTIAGRHEPLLLDQALLCSRCEEIYPCDSRQLLDMLGVPRPPFTDAIGHRVDTPSGRF